MRHVETHAPWGAQITVERIDWDLGYPFQCATDGPAHTAARRALESAFGRSAGEIGSGGSTLLQALSGPPGAEFSSGAPRPRGGEDPLLDESVDPLEIERMILAERSFSRSLVPAQERGIEMRDGARWLIVLVIALVLVGLIAYARGDEHRRGDDVGALRSAVARVDLASREAPAWLT